MITLALRLHESADTFAHDRALFQAALIEYYSLAKQDDVINFQYRNAKEIEDKYQVRGIPQKARALNEKGYLIFIATCDKCNMQWEIVPNNSCGRWAIESLIKGCPRCININSDKKNIEIENVGEKTINDNITMLEELKTFYSIIWDVTKCNMCGQIVTDKQGIHIGNLKDVIIIAHDSCFHATRKNYYQKYLQTTHWITLSENIKATIKKCQLCGNKTNLQIHHNTYENIFNEKPEDLICLCIDCHSKYHDKG